MDSWAKMILEEHRERVSSSTNVEFDSYERKSMRSRTSDVSISASNFGSESSSWHQGLQVPSMRRVCRTLKERLDYLADKLIF
jgi:hypothetical protein